MDGLGLSWGLCGRSSEEIWALCGRSWVAVGASVGAFWRLLGLIRVVSGCFVTPRWRPRRPKSGHKRPNSDPERPKSGSRQPRAAKGASWWALGASWAPLGPSWGFLQDPLGLSWALWNRTFPARAHGGERMASLEKSHAEKWPRPEGQSDLGAQSGQGTDRKAERRPQSPYRFLSKEGWA